MDEKKILVASAHSIIRHGLRLMLNAATPHMVVGDSRPLGQMAGMLETHSPDIVIADVCGQPGEIDLLVPVFSASGGAPKLVVLTDLPESEIRTAGVLLSAAGVIAARGDAMDVLNVVGRIAADRPGEPTLALPRVESPYRADEPRGVRPTAHITPREQQIMELIRQGCCNKRIARALEISVTTVRTHRQKLMAKLGLHNAVEIARYAAGSAVGFGAARPHYAPAHGRGD